MITEKWVERGGNMERGEGREISGINNNWENWDVFAIQNLRHMYKNILK